MSKFEITFEDTPRGFSRGEFTDHYGKACSVQDSSLSSTCVWLGTEDSRMHLTQEQARAVIEVLQRFVDVGSVALVTDSYAGEAEEGPDQFTARANDFFEKLCDFRPGEQVKLVTDHWRGTVESITHRSHIGGVQEVQTTASVRWTDPKTGVNFLREHPVSELGLAK